MAPSVVSSTARYLASSSTVSVANGTGSGGGVSRIVTESISIRSVTLPCASTGASEIACTTSSPSTTRPNTVTVPLSAT